MTLIEVLAVIVIFSLIAASAGVSLAGSDRTAQLAALQSQLRDLDQKARLFAQTAGPVRLIMNLQARAIELRPISSGELLSRMEIPAGFEVRFTIESEMRAYIDFDAFGQSVDYAVAISHSQHTTAWNVCGLTGWMRRPTVEGP